MKVAVIGSGISGLATAYELSKSHEVHLFEASKELGLGGRGYETEIGGKTVKFDIPPRVFNRSYYQELYNFFKINAVETFEIKQAPTFYDHAKDPFLSFATFNLGSLSLSYPSLSLKSLSWLKRHTGELIKWHLFLSRSEHEKLASSVTLRDALTELGLSSGFIESYLYPVWSLMCTCPFKYLDDFPAVDMCRLFKNFTGSAPTLRIKGGTKAVEDKLSKSISRIHLGTKIDLVIPSENGVTLKVAGEDLSFDKVVVATEPKSAIKILDKASYSEEIDLISQVPVFETTMILHTDDSLMPNTNWSAVNLQTHSEGSSAILWMSQIENEEVKKNLFQSWDPIIKPKEDQVLISRSFQRSLCTPESIGKMNTLRDMMRTASSRNTYFAGTYLFEGVPLLENGIKSANLIKSLISL